MIFWTHLMRAHPLLIYIHHRLVFDVKEKESRKWDRREKYVQANECAKEMENLYKVNLDQDVFMGNFQ